MIKPINGNSERSERSPWSALDRLDPLRIELPTDADFLTLWFVWDDLASSDRRRLTLEAAELAEVRIKEQELIEIAEAKAKRLSEAKRRREMQLSVT